MSNRNNMLRLVSAESEFLQNNFNNKSLPLVVNLDNTLARSNINHEQLAAAFATTPLKSLGSLRYLLQGRGAVKRALTNQSTPDIAHLSLREDLLGYLQEQIKTGRKLHLISSADHRLVGKVAKSLGLFTSWKGSTLECNFQGKARLDYLLENFPDGFAYAGHSSSDIQIWREAKSILLIGASEKVVQKVRVLDLPVELEINPSADSGVWRRALRIHQWSKNLLIFAPLLLSPALSSAPAWLNTLLGFLLVSLAASGSYLINDIIDLQADRQHSTKKNRPLASCTIPINEALTVAGLLVLAPLLLSPALDSTFALCLSVYLVTTFSYSFRLKKVPVLDVMVLASLYTLRLVMGMALAGVTASVWILTFAAFFFFSMSLAKRYVEISTTSIPERQTIKGRGYMPIDTPWVLSMGTASSVASILVIIQYLITEAFPSNVYQSPMFLWLVPAAVTLWTARIWLLAVRNTLDDDPVAFAIRDRTSLLLGLVLLITFCISRFY